MKVAKEKVWADAKGNLVPDGDDSAAVLVAAAGQTVTDSHVAQFKGADKFFKDAVFDGDGKQVMPKEKAAPTPPAEAPAPQHREAEMPPLHKRAAKKPKK